ncbi:MAG TPA: PAS domain S-box protein, partial [Gemmatimonadaceae bacterium]|nr:PAS domain S-box protein [Gemmatimonadaceae bacterium]
TELSRLTGILDATPDAVAVFALTGEVLYTNAPAEQLMQHMRRRDWTHAAHLLAPDSVRQLRDVAFPRAIRRGVWQGEARLRNRGGLSRTVVQTLLAHRGPDGRVATVTVMLQDITEQKSLQARLAAGEARNRAIIESLAEGVVVQDRSGRVITWNESTERIFGLSSEQLAAGTPLDAGWRVTNLAGESLTGDARPIARVRMNGVSIDGEVLQLQRDDGHTIWLSVNARAMHLDGDASAPAAVATFTDITKARLVARELETLSVVARQSDHAIATTDRDGRLTWVNSAWERLTGHRLDEVVGQCPGALLQGTHSNPDMIAQLRMAQRVGDSWSGELLNYRKDGSPYWIELSVSPTHDSTTNVTGFVELSRDITARRNADRERQQLAAAVAVTADGIAITGVSGALEFANNAFARMHGHAADDLLQTSWAALYELDEAKRLVREAIPEVTQVGFWHGDATGRRKDGTLYPQELSLTLLPHGGLVAVARDISERMAAEARLKHLSVRDELTSLLNRRGFLEQADAMLRLAARQNVPCALLYGDLDAFKSVNDSFGHDAGDAALQAVAGVLTDTFRETDLISRLGGDEFTILAIGVEPADVAMLIERIDAAVATDNAARHGDAQQSWHLGISLGVAYFDPAAPEHVEGLLRTADAAQYEQKRLRKARRAEAQAA